MNELTGPVGWIAAYVLKEIQDAYKKGKEDGKKEAGFIDELGKMAGYQDKLKAIDEATDRLMAKRDKWVVDSYDFENLADRALFGAISDLFNKVKE